MSNYIRGFLSMFYLLMISGAVGGHIELNKFIDFGKHTPWNAGKILFVGFCVLAILTLTYHAYTGGK